MFTVQKALPLLRPGASVILTGSSASIKGFPSLGVYDATKAAVRSFARSWIVDLKGRPSCQQDIRSEPLLRAYMSILLRELTAVPLSPRVPQIALPSGLACSDLGGRLGGCRK
jgi:hypothetical protein